MVWCWPFRRKKLSPVVRQTIGLMDDYPEQWSLSEHYAVHADGLRVWIHYDWTTHVIMPDGSIAFAKANGCNPTHNHKALWKAIKRLQSGEGRTITAYVALAEQRAQASLVAKRQAAFRADHATIEARLFHKETR
jgi:hypothetical protein